MHAPLRLLLVTLVLVPSLSAEPVPWEQLKIGMSAEELVEVIGEPVSRRQGRGFETWTYDHGAEVLVYGIVVGWTSPAVPGQKVRSQDVWTAHPKSAFIPALQTALRKAVRQPAATVAPANPAPAARPPAVGMGYEEYLRAMRETKA